MLGIEKENKSDREFCLIKTTFDKENEVIEMIKQLLDKKLIVSAQVHTVNSFYVWKGEFYSHDEFELTCFTEKRLYDRVEKFIKKNHSYECCEVICIPILNISDDFGKWIYKYTKHTRD